MVTINIDINNNKRKIEIPQKDLTKEEAVKALHAIIAFGRMCAVAYAGDTVFCSPKKTKDVQEIEEILKEVQINGFPD